MVQLLGGAQGNQGQLIVRRCTEHVPARNLGNVISHFAAEPKLCFRLHDIAVLTLPSFSAGRFLAQAFKPQSLLGLD